MAGLDAARTAAPFLVLAPWTLFVATIGDAVFTAMAAWTIAFSSWPRRDGRAPPRWPRSAVGRGATLHFTYGLVPLLVVVPAAILVAQRRLVLAAPAAAGALAVTAAWVAAGFWWLGGFQATRHWHDVGASVDRPYLYFLFADLVVLAVMLGPAVVAGLVVRPDRALGLLIVSALVAVAVADLSGLSKGEVERIWLPFLPWITLAVVGLFRQRPTQVRAWLAAQAGPRDRVAGNDRVAVVNGASAEVPRADRRDRCAGFVGARSCVS